jgi:hypothetical protein
VPWSPSKFATVLTYEGQALYYHSNAEQAKQTGGMIALYPRQDDALKMAVPGGEPPQELHVTLAFLGDDVSHLDPTAFLEDLPRLLDSVTVITARVMGHAIFNPDGGPEGDREPCAVYLIGDTEQLPELHNDVLDLLGYHSVDFPIPAQHSPFIPHCTAGYSLPIAELSYAGDVLFDRVGLAMGGNVHFFSLLGATS